MAEVTQSDLLPCPVCGMEPSSDPHETAVAAREKALQEAAELCRLPVPAASGVSADYLAGRYDAAEDVRLAILSLIAPERDADHA